MDKYLELIEELKNNEEILRTRNKKKREQFLSLNQENDKIIAQKNKLYQKNIELYNIKKSILEFQNAKNRWEMVDCHKAKKCIISYGIVMISSVLITLGLYHLFPVIMPILYYSIIGITASSSIAALAYSLKILVPTLNKLLKNYKITTTNDMKTIKSKINKNEKKIYDLDKQYERNETKKENISNKIAILAKAIKDLQDLRFMTEYERNEAIELEFLDSKTYTEKESTNILNYCFNNSDQIKRIRIKEREIKNDK